jgi:hypothetical protein
MNREQHSIALHLVARERLRVVPIPRPIPVVPRPLDELDAGGSGRRLPVVPLLVAILPRLRVVLGPLVPLELEGANLLTTSSSSRRRRSSSRLCSSSAALRSATRCFSNPSASCSAKSSVRPFQAGFSIRRWLCSVCERILVHVFNKEDASATVLTTTCAHHR